MELVLIGLPGCGKTAIGRRIARRHGALFRDLDVAITGAAGQTVEDIFAAEGETGFRRRERAAIAELGPADRSGELTRVIAAGGGASIDPRNRWRLFRGRAVIWLDGAPETLAVRVRHSHNPRPLLKGRDATATIRALGIERRRFYAPGIRIETSGSPTRTVDEVDVALVGAAGMVGMPGVAATRLLDAETLIGRLLIGEGIAAAALAETLDRMKAERVIIVSEPGAWAAAGAGIVAALSAGDAGSGAPGSDGSASWVPGSRGRRIERIMLPQGEDAKRLAVVEQAARELVRMRVERTEPLVAIGGGALGDTAGFLAATYLRGIPVIHVPTTLVAQIDSSIGGKTAVDLPEGKNLVGAFHQPAAIVIDVALLRSLPARQLRAALGEAVKMAALGDERLFELLEADGEAIARGDAEVFERGVVAELVERAAWAKVEVVLGDARERRGATRSGAEAAGRMALNLGHSLGHAVEAAGGYSELLHGEAVAYGLRGACHIGVELGVTSASLAARIDALLDRLDLGVGRLPYLADVVRDALGADKKHVGGSLNWILPSDAGPVVRSDVPDEVVEHAIASLLQEAPTR